MKPFKQFLKEAKKLKKQKLFKQIKKNIKSHDESPIVKIDINSKPHSKERKAEIDYMLKHHGAKALKRQVQQNAA